MHMYEYNIIYRNSQYEIIMNTTNFYTYNNKANNDIPLLLFLLHSQLFGMVTIFLHSAWQNLPHHFTYNCSLHILYYIPHLFLGLLPYFLQHKLFLLILLHLSFLPKKHAWAIFSLILCTMKATPMSTHTYTVYLMGKIQKSC